MLKTRVTAAVFGACYVHCHTCADALQLQARPQISKSKSPRRTRDTALPYLNGGRLVGADVDLGSPSDLGDLGQARRSTGGTRRAARRAAPAAPAPGRLTFDEEKEIAVELARLRSVMRARDGLAEWLAREAAGPAARPSERQWADACSLSVDALQTVLARGQAARTRLVEGNAGLVTAIARRYHSASLRPDDLIQEGNLGIMEAAERYDPARGCRFSTFATYWIRQRIAGAVAQSSRTIRLPAHVQAMTRAMGKKSRELRARIGRLPSLPELAHEMGVPLDKVRRYRHATRGVLSLEHPLDHKLGRAGAERERTLGERVACAELATPEEDCLSETLRVEVHALLDALGPDERGVLTHRFGLEAGTPKTLRETAAAMGASVDKVRTTEARALNKLRRPQAHYRLRDYVGGAAAGGDATYAEPPPPQFSHMTVENVGVQNYPQQMNVASWNANDNARDQYLREEHKRHTPESIWSF